MKGVPCTQKSKMVGKICPEMGSTFSTVTIRHKRWYWKIVEKTWSKPPNGILET